MKIGFYGLWVFNLEMVDPSRTVKAGYEFWRLKNKNG